VGAVEALGLVLGREAEEGDDDVGLSRGGDRRVGETLVAGGVGEVETRSEGQAGADAAQLVERGVDARRVDLGAAGALEAGGAGELADDADALGGQRQHVAVVLQQHDAAGRGAPGQRMVGVDVDLRGPAGPGPLDEVQHVPDGGVEHRLVEDA
jgi:hypothetical protein